MEKHKYILVTGSAGFIGFSVCLELLKQGHKVIGIDNFNNYYSPALKEARNDVLSKYSNFICKRIDLENYSELEEIFKSYEIAVVCNLAAQAGVRRSLQEPFVYLKDNIVTFLNILELIRNYNIPKLVYASSSSVYGGNKKMPFSEDDRVDSPVSFYAATKRANELMAHSYSHLYGFQSIGLRFFSVYGPWGRPDMAMWLFTEAMLKGDKIKIFNHGNMKRDCTYIDDIVYGVITSIFSGDLDNYEIFNLGNNKSEPLLDIISIIERELGIEAKKELLPLQPGDIPEAYADIDRAKAKLDFEPATEIREGIPKFIHWYKQWKNI